MVVHVPKFKIGDLKGVIGANLPQIQRDTIIPDDAPGFNQFKDMLYKAINDRIKGAYAVHNKTQYLPGFEKYKPLFQMPEKTAIKPKIVFYLDKPAYDVYLEIVWELPINITEETAQNAVKLLRVLDSSFDTLLANIIRQFWLIVKSKYIHPQIPQDIKPQSNKSFADVMNAGA